MDRRPLRLHWTDRHATGVRPVDDDHQVMVILYNDFSRAMESRASPVCAAGAFDILAAHIRSHVVREDGLLLHRGLILPPQRRIARHDFRAIADIVHASLNADRDRPAAAASLRDWICEHLSADHALLVPRPSDEGLCCRSSALPSLSMTAHTPV
ncbi:hypothetical protein [Azospirillum halopraeferens]|uniref:hypothetical protein n=1 Tax=Azospirillum halopraeferens TaxID=34010 RepID=UPI0004257E02|nr:hypothetical protein [Azospirillum halopraeferens]